MNVLVTGGLGYIGSHTVVQLIEDGHEVIVMDNLSNSSWSVLVGIEEITKRKVIHYVSDATLLEDYEDIFLEHEIDAAIHFAGYKSVSESVTNPLKYYENNFLSTLNLAKACLKFNIKKIIFSSSASVYGNNISPVVETMELAPSQSPYGETKVMCEKLLTDFVTTYPDFSVSILRYFNPVGYHESGLLQYENPESTDINLMSHIVQVARGQKDTLKIYGQDYPTLDGTCIRDYIHIKDLARGHVLALNNMKSNLNIYNLGTGNGYSVLQLVEKFEEVNQARIPYEIVERRRGEIEVSFADCGKAREEIGFMAEYGIDEMCKNTIINK